MTTPPSSNISRRHFIGISALATGTIPAGSCAETRLSGED